MHNMYAPEYSLKPTNQIGDHRNASRATSAKMIMTISSLIQNISLFLYLAMRAVFSLVVARLTLFAVYMRYVHLCFANRI